MADQLTIQNGKVKLTTEEGQRVERPEDDLLAMLRDDFVPPLGDTALPDGVKFCEWRPPLLLVVHQLPPHVRQFRWIAPDSPRQFGPGTVYRKVRLSIPYAITFALYAVQNGRHFLAGNNELYFRNEPLRGRADRLGFPALLNVSRLVTPKRERTWVCTQYLRFSPKSGWTDQLQSLLEHTWNGGFNLSSEHHEGSSWYGASEGIHPDLHPVERWEKASAANDAFALGVPWKPAPLTVAEVMDALFEEQAENQRAARGAKTAPPAGLASRFMTYALRKK